MKPKFNTCVNTECVSWMNKVKKPFADLVIADPPFNINWEYDVYLDKMSDDDFRALCDDTGLNDGQIDSLCRFQDCGSVEDIRAL